nr:hypothetical protein [Sphingomonas sp. ID1715]
MLRSILVIGLIAAALPAAAQTVSDTAGMTPPPSTDPAIVVENSPERAALADKAVPTTIATKGEIKLAVDPNGGSSTRTAQAVSTKPSSARCFTSSRGSRWKDRAPLKKPAAPPRQPL